MPYQSTHSLQANVPRLPSQRRQARDYSRGSEWRLARAAWECVAQNEAEDWEAQFRLCEASFWLGDAVNCTIHGEQACRLRPKDQGPLLYLGRAYSHLNDFGSAHAVWQRLIAADPNFYEGWFRLAQCQAQRGRFGDACVSLERALTLQPQNPSAYPIIDLVLSGLAHDRVQLLLKRWLLRIESSRTGAAAEVRSHLSRRHQSLARKALAQMRAGGPPGSESKSRAKAATGTPTNTPAIAPAVILRDARALHTRKRWEEACVAWKRHLTVVPGHFESQLRLGEALMAMQRPKEAVGLLEQAHRSNPDHLKALCRYTECLAALGRRRDGIRLWRDGAELHDGDPTWQTAHAMFLADNKSEGLARKIAVQILRSTRRPDRNTFTLVRLLTKFGDSEAIVESLRGVCRRDSAAVHDQDSMELVGRYALAVESLGRMREALDWLQWADGTGPCNKLVVRNLIRMLGRLDQVDRARSVVERMLQRAGSELWAWQAAIDAMVSLGRFDDAQKYFSRACRDLELSLPDWLDLAERITIPDTRADVLSQIRLATTADASLLERLSRVSFRHGDIRLALDLARRASGAAGHQPAIHTTMAEVAYYNAEFARHGFDIGDVSFPDSAFEIICRHILDNPREAASRNRTIVMGNSSLAAGGAERQIAMTLRGLSQVAGADLDLHLACRDLNPAEAKDAHLALIRDSGVAVIDLSKTAEPRLDELPGLSGTERRLIQLFDPKLRADLIQHYVEFVRLRPSVVHLWQDRTNLIGAVAAALAGVPRIILGARSTRPVARQRFRPFMLRAYRAVLALPGVVLCNNSRSGAADYAEWLHLPESAIEVIYNGFKFDELITADDIERAKDNRRSIGLGPDDQLVGGVFRIAPVKRPMLWIETAALVCAKRPNVHFLIAGDGPLREETEQRARDLAIADRVHFVGHVAVGSWYPAMDALLLTSVTEGLPNVVIEAQAAGVPVVSTDVGGVREIIADGRTGFAVDDASATTLADRLLRVLSDSAWYETAKAEARSSAQARFGADAMVAQTLAAYRLRAAKRRSSRSARADAERRQKQDAPMQQKRAARRHGSDKQCSEPAAGRDDFVRRFANAEMAGGTNGRTQ